MKTMSPAINLRLCSAQNDQPQHHQSYWGDNVCAPGASYARPILARRPRRKSENEAPNLFL